MKNYLKAFGNTEDNFGMWLKLRPPRTCDRLFLLTTEKTTKGGNMELTRVIFALEVNQIQQKNYIVT